MGPWLDETSRRSRRILIVDDQEIVHAGFRLLLEAQSWVASCVGASNCHDALDVRRRHRPHVAVIDMVVSGRPGLELCRDLVRQDPYLKVIVMSANSRTSARAVRAFGGRGFLAKGSPAGVIVETIRLVAEGVTVFPAADAGAATHLTRRELDVLETLVRGMSNPEVAATLHLSRHTVKEYTSAIYRKLGVRNRAEAAGRARELGLVS